MAQISITGKDSEISFIKENYNKLGIVRAPRMVDLAINDINNLIKHIDITENHSYDLLAYEMKKFDEQFILDINLFEPTLIKIKSKINNNYDDAINHFDIFIEKLNDLHNKLIKYKDNHKNFDALEEEWINIKILISYLKNKERGKIFEWYSKYKKSDIIYDYFKSKYGFSDVQINKIQHFISEMKKEFIDNKNKRTY